LSLALAQSEAGAQAASSGIAWWVWLIVAIVVIGAIWAFASSRKKPDDGLPSKRGRDSDPSIKTRR